MPRMQVSRDSDVDYVDPKVTPTMTITLPTKVAVDVGSIVSVGVQGGRRPPPVGEPGKRKMHGHEAATRSDLFKAGGSAFTRWLIEQGIDPVLKRIESEWQDLLTKFATRPIHGHRRGPNGGSHRRR